jgi:hypothetical protein
MIIAVGMAAVVGMALYAIYNSQQRAASGQKVSTDLQTSCGFVLGQIKQDLLLAGYRGDESGNVRTFSAVHHTGGVSTNPIDGITFEYYDDKAKWPDVASTEPNYDPGIPWSSADYSALTQVKFDFSGGQVIRRFSRFHPASGAYPSYISQTLATGIQKLEFHLYDDEGNALSNPSGAAFDQIRTVGIELTCRAPKADQLTGRTREVTIADTVKPRNVGLEANPKDATPPAVPTGVASWDPGVCSNLQLRWNANTESDLAGYTIYYGFAAGDYSNRVRVSRAPQAAGHFEYLTLSGLTPTKFTDAAAATYHVVITAYDKSGNQSSYSSPEVAANPTPSTLTEAAIASNGSDTTITIPAAPAPSGFAAAPGDEGQVNLTWPTAAVAGLAGYRLYRSADPAFVPNDNAVPGGTLLATLGADKTGYTDTGADQPGGHLKGCTPYYYKLAAIHCDATIPTSALNFAEATGTPVDNTPPPPPLLTARPGYRRIILTLQNPSAESVPDFKETKIWFSKVDYPTLTDGTVSGGTLVPDKDAAENTPGSFTSRSTQSINFNSETNGNPAYSNPELAADQTYYFIAVSYDQCGQHSLVTGEAKAEGAQCNDCLAGETCYDAPPPPFNQRAEGCGGPITVSWDYPYLSQTDVYRDLTGFHVYRRDGAGWVGGTNEVELTSPDGNPAHGNPIWLTSFQDSSAQPGVVYSYRIESTDCYFERRSTWPLPGDDLANSPANNYSETFLSDLYTGAFKRQFVDISVKRPLTAALDAAATTITVTSTAGLTGGGNTVQIGSERITCTGASTATTLTGCTRGVGGTTATGHAAGEQVYRYPIPPPVGALTGGLYLTPPDFGHHIVSLIMENTAAGALTLNQMTASWENTQAWLRSLIVGDGNTTPITTSFSAAPPLTNGSTGTAITLANTPISALDTVIPFTLTFNRQDGSVDSSTNMRQDTIQLGLSWRNNSTGSQCPNPAAAPVAVAVPLGPVASGVTMDKPSAGTLAIAVPGEGTTANPMNTVIVPGGTRVNVFVDVADGSLAGTREVKLYYALDPGRTLTAAPPVLATASYPSLSPYTAIPMTYVAGNQWRTPAGLGIPISDTNNVWFFILAVDNHGNFDREPEIAGGAFQYYQQQTDVCQNTPNPPALSGTSSSTGVTLTLTKPTLNTDGSNCTDFTGYKIYRKVGNGAYALVATIASTVSPYTYTEVPPSIGASGNDYTYYAVAYDSCVPPKVSAASATFTECEGAPTCMLTVSSSRTPIYAGDTFTVDLTVCSKQNGTSGERLWIQDCSSADLADPIEVIESGDTGSFRIDSAVYGRDAVKTYLLGAVAPDPLAYPAAAINLDLKVAATDTITVAGYSDVIPPATWDSTCQSAALQCSTTLGVVPDPCTVTPTAPGQVTITSIDKDPTKNCSSTDSPTVTLTWAAVPGATSYTVYRCSGATCIPNSGGSTVAAGLTGTTFTDTPGSRLDKSVFRYSVQAVANPCPANYAAVPGPVSGTVTDPCP